MKSTFAPLLAASMLCTSALVVPAAAQSGNLQPNTVNACDELDRLVNQFDDNLRDDWTTNASNAVAARNLEECRTYYNQAASELDAGGEDLSVYRLAIRIDDEDGQQVAQMGEMAEGQGRYNTMAPDAAARIVVTQPDPNVQVDQAAPQIAVTQSQPEVSVNQGRPQIAVRQASPNVTVQMPRPTITIDQPQPQIIVRMPEPQVAVNQARPQIEVRQAQPSVDVSLAEPQVSVRAGEGANEQTSADVDIAQQEPNVRFMDTEGEPQIDVQRQQAEVTYEAAEPNVRVETGGDPIVRFNRTGEPQIIFQDAEGRTAEAGQTGNQLGTQGMMDDEELTGSVGTDADQLGQQNTGTDQQQVASAGERDVLSLIGANGQQRPELELSDYQVRQLIGQRLYNAGNDDLGVIDAVVEADGLRYVVLSEDSVLATGGQGVVLPVANVMMSADDQLVLMGLTDQELRELAQYDGENARYVGNNQTIEIATR